MTWTPACLWGTPNMGLKQNQGLLLKASSRRQEGKMCKGFSITINQGDLWSILQ